MTASTDTMAHDLDAVVTAVPGVVQVYRPTPTKSALAVVAAGLVESADVDELPRVRIDDDDVVSVTIGTSDEEPTPGVARAVHAALDARCRAAGFTPARIDVTVARIG